jgi:uncharacterized protein
MARMWTGAALVLIIAAVLLLLIWIGQRQLIYFPYREVSSPAAVGLSGVETIRIPVEDGVVLNGWFLPAPAAPPFTVIVFNGNAGNRSYRASLAAALRARGLAVLLFDYRGFGENPGAPSQKGLEADARAVYAYATQRADVRPDRLVYFGESLGTAVATSLAARHPPAALVLRSPFASLTEVGQFHYPVLPVGWLLRDRFAAIDLIATVRAPVLVIAGDRDRVVPLEQSQRLFDKAAQPKQMVVVQGADHNDAALFDGAQLIEATMGFLGRLDAR